MHNLVGVRHKIMWIFLTLALLSCSEIAGRPTQQQLYEAGIMDAAVASPQKIVPLKPIPEGYTVSFVAWVAQSRVPCDGKTECDWIPSTKDYTWVTLDGEVKQQCQQWNLTGDKLRARLEQLLGLPPDSPPRFQKVKFVTLKISRASVARACRGIKNEGSARPECTLDADDDTPTEIKNYVQQQMANAYIVHVKDSPGYPFTRLGYTYDWNPKAAKNHYGASEFLIAPNTAARVTAINTTDEYCGKNKP